MPGLNNRVTSDEVAGRNQDPALVFLTIIGGCVVLIHIVRSDNHYDYVKEFLLSDLIEAQGIVKFKRSTTGWVTLGIDPIRKGKPASVFSGTERRTI